MTAEPWREVVRDFAAIVRDIVDRCACEGAPYGACPGCDHYRALLARAEALPAEPVASATEPAADWHCVTDDTAFAKPFGTVRQCIDCGALVGGGPTRCVRCAKASATEPDSECPNRCQPVEPTVGVAVQWAHEMGARIGTLERERDAALARAESLAAEVERLRDDVAVAHLTTYGNASDALDEAGVAQVNSEGQIMGLESRVRTLAAELATMTQAVGLATTIKGDMIVRADQPIKMMREVAAYVDGLRAELATAYAQIDSLQLDFTNQGLELATARRDAANRVRRMAALFSFRSLALTVSEAMHECSRAADDIERGPAKE